MFDLVKRIDHDGQEHVDQHHGNNHHKTEEEDWAEHAIGSLHGAESHLAEHEVLEGYEGGEEGSVAEHVTTKHERCHRSVSQENDEEDDTEHHEGERGVFESGGEKGHLLVKPVFDMWQMCWSVNVWTTFMTRPSDHKQQRLSRAQNTANV